MNPLSISSLANTPQAADFSQTPWWMAIIKAVFILVFLLVSVIMALWVERRVVARIQTRPGPNVHGPFGLLQAVADAAKLLLKEDIWHKKADKVIWVLAPLIAAFSAFMIYAVIPFGPNVNIFGYNTPLQLTDMPVATIYILAIASLGVYGIVLGGWSSNSTFPLLGAVRSAAQVISYELAMGLSLVSVFLMSGSMSTSQIVAAQTNAWWGFLLAPAFVVYFISMLGEVNRLPFDLPEAEGELVAGHMVEFSSMKFAWFFLAEYVNMFNVSAVATTLFLGGWRAPFGLSYINGGMFNEGWWPMLWFIGKVWFFMVIMVWIRGTLLRFRYDQFMKLGWKVLIPIALGWVVLLAVLRGISEFTALTQNQLLIGIGAIFAVAVIVVLLVPEKKEAPVQAGAETFDAFAGGYPLPPLPGQSLGPSPRAGRSEVVPAPTAKGDTNE